MRKWTFKAQEWNIGNRSQTTPKPTPVPVEKENRFPNFKKTLLVRSYSTHTYGIEGYEGMTEDEIIDACDANNFGGYVHGNIATIYID